MVDIEEVMEADDMIEDTVVVADTEVEDAPLHHITAGVAVETVEITAAEADHIHHVSIFKTFILNIWDCVMMSYFHTALES